MSAACNTGPLIALAKVDQLRLLERLFTQVYVPPSVQRELQAKAGIEAERLDQAFAAFVAVAETPEITEELQAATQSLGAGEREMHWRWRITDASRSS
jgi:predicted nucleic acid-binding protein